MESNREHVAGIFSRLALEDAPVGTLERERELIEPDVVRASVATNPDLVFTHRRNDSEMHNGTTPSHHANGHMSAAVPFIEKDAELPTQPLSHHVQQVCCFRQLFILVLLRPFLVFVLPC
ncbi:unnamed protein product [Toxocara canis]|uniref:Uncharacterized protein n=1 Tax=Toxocara canis TaxID=6265 RepID=A0A183U2M0_TOXCA|nr:unnamed protein product [Toxocara canis]